MDNAYQWVPFYEALADKLLAYNDKRNDLFELMKKVASEQPFMNYLHFEHEEWWGPRQYQIDPFSVIGVMNRGNTDANRTMLAKVMADTFDIPLPAPMQFAGIPILDNRKSFFAGVDEVWNLFVLALKAAETNNFTAEFKTAFEKAIAVKGNGLAYITIGLYWIRPHVFMPLDSNSRAFISKQYGISVSSGTCSGDVYVTFLNTLKTKIDEQTPELTFPEISYTAWTQKDSSSVIPTVDDQQQRATFKKWYINNVGTSNSANTISTAISKAKLKNGLAIFAITDSNELDTAIKSSGLDEYFQSSSGEYEKMDAVFDIEPSAQRDDLKSGIKHYLNFLKSSRVSDSTNESTARKNDSSTITGSFKMEKNILLFGAPGTGKTYSTVQYAVCIIEEKPLNKIKDEDYDAVFARYLKYKDDGLVAFITFHQSFGYEEFIEGIRPVVISEDKSEEVREIEYEVHDGVFKAFCDKAGTPINDRIPNRVFIIDEINRGNISKIFGELITLIEPSKRIGSKEQLRAILPYSGQRFGVPNNVYIIGTMNTADRSIALIDTALRRRFGFVEMMPEPALLIDVLVDKVIDIAEMLYTINKRITVLLDREHTIGHSYLLPLKYNPTIEQLAEIFKGKIIPLLQEYFYDDYEKIQLVLGDNQKSDDSTRFIIKKNDTVKLFGNTDIDFPDYYEINNAAFMRIDAYAFM